MHEHKFLDVLHGLAIKTREFDFLFLFLLEDGFEEIRIANKEKINDFKFLIITSDESFHLILR